MENTLSKKFNAKSLILYAIPTIITMIFMNTYTIVDGIFVSKYVGEDALAAVNIVMPAFMIAMALSMVFATGGNAIVGKLMGEGKAREAKRFFTTIYMIGAIIGILTTVVLFVFLDPIISMLGADANLISYCKDYLSVYSLFIISTILQIFTQSFFITAGKPVLGFIVCSLGGVVNMISDWIFISPNILNLGIAGAAWATGIGATIPALFGVIYFAFNRKGTLCFVKPSWSLKQIGQSMYNGASEFVGAMAGAVTMLLFNLIMMDLAGGNGVAAISAILYLQGISAAVCQGYAFGVSPIISYKYGEQNYPQLKKIINASFKFIWFISVIVILACIVFTEPLVALFIERYLKTGILNPTFKMAVSGMRIFAISFIFSGSNTFLSALFTALSNGKVSAILSFMRTFVFTVASVLFVPKIMQIFGLAVEGVFLSVGVAEFLTILLGICFFKRNKSVYHY